MSAPVAVIAGAGGGGTATALDLASAGFVVVILDRSADLSQAAVDSVIAEGGAAEGHGIDLLDVEAVAALRADLLARHGRVDVLVHLVGGWRGTKTLQPESVDVWNSLNPPIVGTLAALTAVFAEDIRTSPVGRAFMVTSTAAANPTPGNIAYASAKAAAETWMAGLAAFLRDTDAASVVVAVKALLTDRMVEAEPEKSWDGYTHVRDLAAAIRTASTGPVANGARLDLTAAGYSTP